MKLVINSTENIVSIEGIPCRQWIAESIDGVQPSIESHVYTRLLMLPASFKVDDPHLISLVGPHPPNEHDLRDPVTDLDDVSFD